MFYREYPDLGSDGNIMQHIARRMGIQAEIVQTSSLGSVKKNGEILAEHLHRETGNKLLICTMSKGASDLRYALEHLAPAQADKIHTWINVCGTVHGSAYVDKILQSRAKRLWFRTACKSLRADYGCLEQLRASHPYWQKSWQLPPALRVINILPLPLVPHLHKKLSQRHTAISHLGPNDGIMLPYETIYQPGLIYPVWGTTIFCEPH